MDTDAATVMNMDKASLVPRNATNNEFNGRKRTFSQQDVFSMLTNWTNELGCSTQSLELASALEGMGDITSHHIAEATRLMYTQVYKQICEYAASLNPPMMLNISQDPIPADVIVSYFRVLFTGIDKPVLSGEGHPLMMMMADGMPRKGRGLSEGTFRKHYHGLKTLHLHFHRKHVYEFNDEISGKEIHATTPLFRVYTGYLKMFHDPNECHKYGRKFDCSTKRAPVFRIAHLMSLYNVCQVKRNAYTMRGWTYILLSCSLFLRKSEAAALMVSDIDVPTNHVTGEVLLQDGLPRFLYILIRRSKTDQGQGQRLLLQRNIENYKLCPVLTLMTWLAILRLKYRLTTGTVFPTLSTSSLGDALNLETFRKIFKNMMDDGDLTAFGFKTHSCRRTAAYYAAWQKVPETTIKLLGRWDSQVYQTYVDSADIDREWEETCSFEDEDPISTNFNIFGNLAQN